MNIIASLRKYIRQRNRRKALQNRAVMEETMLERVQIKEFAGRTYIAYDGLPIVPVEMLKEDLIRSLKLIRNTIVDYKTQATWKAGFDCTAR